MPMTWNKEPKKKIRTAHDPKQNLVAFYGQPQIWNINVDIGSGQHKGLQVALKLNKRRILPRLSFLKKYPACDPCFEWWRTWSRANQQHIPRTTKKRDLLQWKWHDVSKMKYPCFRISKTKNHDLLMSNFKNKYFGKLLCDVFLFMRCQRSFG